MTACGKPGPLQCRRWTTRGFTAWRSRASTHTTSPRAERKGCTKEEGHTVIHWLTGYDDKAIEKLIEKRVDFETFFAQAPRMNPNASKITGLICGYRIEEIEDKVMREVRYLDKLVDKLAKGRAMDKILRK